MPARILSESSLHTPSRFVWGLQYWLRLTPGRVHPPGRLRPVCRLLPPSCCPHPFQPQSCSVTPRDPEELHSSLQTDCEEGVGSPWRWALTAGLGILLLNTQNFTEQTSDQAPATKMGQGRNKSTPYHVQTIKLTTQTCPNLPHRTGCCSFTS